jgi:hypothetical protein
LRVRLVQITLGRDAAASPLTRATLVDCLWAATPASDQVEHITVGNATIPERLEIGFFLRSADSAAGHKAAVGIVERALHDSPGLRRWTIVASRLVVLDETTIRTHRT